MASIPDVYDVRINGAYYRFADSEQKRALYALSPTFLERQSIQTDYGDNQYDFWLTWTQRDWSLGEQQKFYRQDENRSRKSWLTVDVDVRTAGQISLRPKVTAVTFAAAPVAAVVRGGVNDNMIVVTGTAIYELVGAGTLTTHNNHTISSLKRWGVCSDGSYVYISSYGDDVMRWSGDPIETFSTADGADSLEFVNNTLYGLTKSKRTAALDTGECKLVRWDTVGVREDLFQWKQVNGAPRIGRMGRLKAFGGKLLILWSDGPNGSELWEYDGIAPAMIAQFPRNFFAYELEIVSGVIFISGSYVSAATNQNILRPAVYYYANGTQGLLWKATDTISTNAELEDAAHPALTAYDDGLVFSDPSRGALIFYDITIGGIHRIATYSNPTTGKAQLAAGQRFLLMMHAGTDGYLFPEIDSVKVTSGSVTHSLVDFDLSLTKYVKSIKYDGVVPAGATVDLAYRLDDVDGAYTTLQTGAVSGTEYAVNASAKAISVKVTLNKGSSSNGPVIKRVFLRAVPVQESYKRRDYVLDLTGRDGESPILLRDGTYEARDGRAMADALNTAAVATSPIAIQDRFGTYNGVIEPDGYQIIEIRPDEFVGMVRVREV